MFTYTSIYLFACLFIYYLFFWSSFLIINYSILLYFYLMFHYNKKDLFTDKSVNVQWQKIENFFSELNISVECKFKPELVSRQ